MTRQELDEKLSDPATFEQFKNAVGGPGQGQRKEWYLDELTRNPQNVEAKWAAFFKIQTEEQRKTQANLDIAAAAKDSTRHAEEANRIAREANEIADKANEIAARADKKAGYALVVSIVALLVSIIMAWRTK
jgi:hypothetical protein